MTVETEQRVGGDSEPWRQRYPELGTAKVSTDRYLSQDWYEREKEHIFRKCWLNVGAAYDLDGPRSFFVRDLEFLGVSLLIVQDASGDIRGFHNVCSHRQNKLVWESSGHCASQVACRFHGWTYGLDGCLLTVPDEVGFHHGPDFDKQDLGLVSVRTGVWNGFVFVNLDADGEQSLEDYLGELGEDLNQYPFDKLELAYRYDLEDAANWKVAVDAQNEIYHIPFLAPMHRLFAPSFQMNDDGSTRLKEFVKLPPLHTVVTSEFGSYVPTRLEAALFAGLHASDTTIEKTEVFASETETGARAPFAFYVLFPNTVFALLGDTALIYNFWPLAVDRCIWEVRVLTPPAKNLGDLVTSELARDRARDTICEDLSGHEHVQAGLRSRARDYVVLQDQEIQIRSFHRTLDSFLAQG
jgi:phenylpropionate dioxygenase-like ring-hydroxylating dioxygenase large terminal subunit